MSPLFLLFLQDPTTPAAPPALDLRQAPVVAEQDRILLSPKIDGRIEDEEWDPLGVSGTTHTFLQWEPGALHVAASGTASQDLLISIDGNGDGWLVGKDNIEARITLRDGKAVIKVRILDATNVSGPEYNEVPGLDAASVAAVGPDGSIEATLVDPGLGFLPKSKGKLSARIDVVRSDEPSLPSTEPRTLAALRLRDFRAALLPAGLKATADFNDIPVVPGELVSIRFGFEGAPMPTRIGLRTEGLGREATSAMEMPFPSQNKKSVKIDYKTKVLGDAPVGYRIARATIQGSDGIPAVVQASYRVAPLVDLDLKDPVLKSSDKDRSLRMSYMIKGNAGKQLEGQTTISAPAPFHVTNGEDVQKFFLGEPRKGMNKSFGFFIPANAKGTVPITFSFVIGKQKFDLVRYVTID